MANKFVAIALIAVVGVAAKFGVDFMMDPARPDPTPTQMEATLLASPVASTNQAVREYFPDDADQWLDEMVDLEIARRAGTFAPQDAIDVGAKVRQKYAPYLASAPDASLVDVMAFQVILHELFEDDPLSCAKLLMHGPGGLDVQDRDKILDVIDGARVQLKAMYDGLNEPASVASSTDDDWAQFYDAFLANGYSAEDYERVIEPNQDDPELCNAFLGFFRTLRDSQFDGAARIRAEVVPALVGS